MSLWAASNQATTGVDSGTNPYRYKDALYFLPSDDEWYKAAYHKNDGVTANYWAYPTGADNAPDGVDFAGDPDFGAVFGDGYFLRFPYEVTSVGSSASAYGTYGQGGNVWEWMEGAYVGANDSPGKNRAFRGSYYGGVAGNFSDRVQSIPNNEGFGLGFRVASIIPEPTTLSLLALGSLALVMARRRR